MIFLIENSGLRRLVTVTATFLLFAIVTLLLPMLLVAGLALDVFRSLFKSRPAMATRIVTFVWIYLTGEVWAIVALGGVVFLGAKRSVTATYRLQELWAQWNYQALRVVFSIKFIEAGSASAHPTPIIVLARHASLIDSLIPALFITAKHGVLLRYVLKKELLWDPALDIAGNRLPNHFVDRSPSDLDRELTAIAELGRSMQPDEGIVIFPEGTRFSERKLERAIQRTRNKSGRVAEITREFQSVLPPRPAGTLALLESALGDVVVIAHTGLEGFARLVDVWDGGLVGREVRIQIWRVRREEIPVETRDQVEWLYSVWSQVDDWIGSQAEII